MQNTRYQPVENYRDNNQISQREDAANPSQMFNFMANRMMSRFGEFGSFFGREEFPSMMSRLENDDDFGSFGGVFGPRFMDMDSMFGKMLSEGERMQGSNQGGGQLSRLPGGGFVQAQTYCFSQSMGEDGKPVTKKYFAHKTKGMGQDGDEFGEMQEMYHNTANQRKVIAEERTVNGDGTRIVKSKVGEGKFVASKT